MKPKSDLYVYVCTYVTVRDKLSSLPGHYLTSLDLGRAPAFQINHNRHPPASGDDPDDVLIALIYFLVLGPRGDEGEVAGREGSFLIRREMGMDSKVGIVEDGTLRCELAGGSEGAEEADDGSVLECAGAGVGVREGLVIIVPCPLAA